MEKKNSGGIKKTKKRPRGNKSHQADAFHFKEISARAQRGPPLNFHPFSTCPAVAHASGGAEHSPLLSLLFSYSLLILIYLYYCVIAKEGIQRGSRAIYKGLYCI